MHGANRLASNSLLEALVYGSRVATDIVNADAHAGENRIAAMESPLQGEGDAQAISDLRNVMYTNVGLVRHERRLREALGRIRELERTFAGVRGDLRNLLVVGRLVAEAALARRESRGSHFRSDFAEADEALAEALVHPVRKRCLSPIALSSNRSCAPRCSKISGTAAT